MVHHPRKISSHLVSATALTFDIIYKRGRKFAIFRANVLKILDKSVQLPLHTPPQSPPIGLISLWLVLIPRDTLLVLALMTLTLSTNRASPSNQAVTEIVFFFIRAAMHGGRICNIWNKLLKSKSPPGDSGSYVREGYIKNFVIITSTQILGVTITALETGLKIWPLRQDLTKRTLSVMKILFKFSLFSFCKSIYVFLLYFSLFPFHIPHIWISILQILKFIYVQKMASGETSFVREGVVRPSNPFQSIYLNSAEATDSIALILFDGRLHNKTTCLHFCSTKYKEIHHSISAL